jgi:hypothetical protein
MRIALAMWTSALLLRPLKHVVALPTLVKVLRPRRIHDDVERREAMVRALSAYMERRGPAPFRAPGNCLERSLGAYRLLCAVGAGPRMVVGVRAVEGGVDGHVWIELDGRPFGDATERVAQYTAVASFDAAGHRVSSSADETLTRGIRWA